MDYTEIHIYEWVILWYMVTFKQVVYAIGVHLRESPDIPLTMELLTNLCRLDGKNIKNKQLVRTTISHYPELFKIDSHEISPRKKVKFSLTEHGKRYFEWLEPIYDSISDTIYIDNKLAFNDSRKSNIIKI